MALEWLTKWFRTEDRQVGDGQSGVNSYISDLDTYYSADGTAEINQTAAVEFALGMVGRSFMLARPRPELAVLNPLTLAMIARQTVATGNAVFQIAVNLATGEPRLLPIASYELAGGIRPETWTYLVEQERASGDMERRGIPYAGVVHVRYLPPSTAPWQGVSPLTRAGLTAQQLAFIERSLRYDVEPRPGYILPMPDGASQTVVNQAKNALQNGRGAHSLVETTSGGFGMGMPNAPRSDWEQKRFGPNVPQTSVDLRDKSALAVMSAMGIPPSLYTSQGAALRESWRHFHSNTILPLAAIMQQELSEKLEIDFEFTFPEVARSDISARSRAFAQFLNARIPIEQALELSGLPPVDLPEQIQAPQGANNERA